MIGVGRKWLRPVLAWGSGGIILCALGAALVWVPEKMVSSLQAKHVKDFKDYAEVVDKYRSTLAQAIGGGVLIIGLYFTAKSVAAAEQTRWTKTFADAIVQLGEVNKDGIPVIAVRLGAIYALERLSRDSPKDAYVICRILAQYIQVESKGRRKRSPSEIVAAQEEESSTTPMSSVSEMSEPILGDLEAALIVLGIITRGKPLREDERLRLYDCFLPNLTLSGRNFGNFQFHRGILSASRLDSSDCSAAEFRNCEMNSCTFANCKLARAEFNNVRGAGMNFSSARSLDSRFLTCSLPDSDFSNAFLDRCDFSDSDLKGSAFTGASMVGVVMSDADVADVSFDRADLSNADFRTAHHLTQEQLASAKRQPPPRLLPAYLQVKSITETNM